MGELLWLFIRGLIKRECSRREMKGWKLSEKNDCVGRNRWQIALFVDKVFSLLVAELGVGTNIITLCLHSRGIRLIVIMHSTFLFVKYWPAALTRRSVQVVVIVFTVC